MSKRTSLYMLKEKVSDMLLQMKFFLKFIFDDLKLMEMLFLSVYFVKRRHRFTLREGLIILQT